MNNADPFRPSTRDEFDAFLTDDSVYEVDLPSVIRSFTEEIPFDRAIWSQLSQETAAYLDGFVRDPTRTLNRDRASTLEGLSTLIIILLVRVASGRPPSNVAKQSVNLLLDAAMRAEPKQPLSTGLKLWADLVNAYGGKPVYGRGLRAIVYLLLVIHAEPNAVAFTPYLPAVVKEVTRLLVDDPSKLADLSPVRWEQLRARCAKSALTWMRWSAGAGVPLSEGPARLRYAFALAKAMQNQGFGIFSLDEALEVTRRLLARGIDLTATRTFLDRYGEARVLWLSDPGTRVDARFLRALSRMAETYRSAEDADLNRMEREWRELQAMGTAPDFTVGQFLELGGTLERALEELSRPEPRPEPTNVVDLFPPRVPVQRRLRLAVQNVSPDDLELRDLALGKCAPELVRALLGEIWRIGFPGHFDPSRAVSEMRVERICVPKCRASRGQFAETVAWLIVEGAIRREGTDLFPGPSRTATALGRTLAERATALKRSSLVPE